MDFFVDWAGVYDTKFELILKLILIQKSNTTSILSNSLSKKKKTVAVFLSRKSSPRRNVDLFRFSFFGR